MIFHGDTVIPVGVFIAIQRHCFSNDVLEVLCVCVCVCVNGLDVLYILPNISKNLREIADVCNSSSSGKKLTSWRPVYGM